LLTMDGHVVVGHSVVPLMTKKRKKKGKKIYYEAAEGSHEIEK
jgi:hypothetical protein